MANITLENFTNLITGKFFISIESSDGVLSFTGLDQIGIDLRNAATEANVIVFLPSINKIFARGSYYGIENSENLISKLEELDSQFESLGESLSDLAGLVHTQGNSINTNSTDILSLQTLIGNNIDSENQQIINNANGIIGKIVELQQSISALSPGGQDLSQLVNSAVETALTNQLESKLQSSTTISNISTTLSDKVDQSDFDNITDKLGIEYLPWENPTEQNPNPNNKTVVEKLNNLIQDVSQIPKFDIKIVDATNNGLPDVEQNEISKTTIYLVRSENNSDPTNNEIFTEYIYVNLDKGKINAETGEPLPERWGWESLGRQYFNVSSFVQMDQEEFDQLKDQILADITAIQNQLGDADIQQISTNTENIRNIQTSLGTLVNNDNSFKLTGENIKTNTQGNETIATDISNLQNNKLDKTSLEWVIISE